MERKNMAEVISSRRKALGMTQKALADKMHVTDKAVSKWERGVACPDTASIPLLAEVLGISLETLLSAEPVEPQTQKKAGDLVERILAAVPLAMGIAVTVTALLGELDTRSGFAMLGLGLACVGFRQLKNT